jgi:hypothetical protein
MKFHDYLESTHVETNISNQLAYSPNKQSRILAAASLISVQRTLLKYYNFWLLLAQYALTSIGLLSAPKSANQLISEYNAQVKVKMDAAAAQAAGELAKPASLSVVNTASILDPVDPRKV